MNGKNRVSASEGKGMDLFLVPFPDFDEAPNNPAIEATEATLWAAIDAPL
jgi:hypothetical protein